MAFTNANLSLVHSSNGHGIYVYKSDSDAPAAVMASGYFNNTDDDLNLASDDLIHVVGDKGFYALRVDTVSSGVVTTEIAWGGIWIPVRIANLADSASHFGLSPVDGFVNRLKVVAEGAISADTAVGLELGGVDVTGAQLTLTAAASAAGDVTEGAATAANAVSEGAAIEVTCDGAGATASAANAYVEIIPA